jgi:hypothetical protein
MAFAGCGPAGLKMAGLWDMGLRKFVRIKTIFMNAD